MGVALLNNAPTSPSPVPQALMDRMKNYGQEHIFSFWNNLTAEEKDLLVQDIESIDFPRTHMIIQSSLQSKESPFTTIKPVKESDVTTVEGRTLEESERWWKMGLNAIWEKKVAVLLLSGGQGTRLGSSDPKGCFNIGLPSGKSLFQLQAERLLRIQRLAAQCATEGTDGSGAVHWYIMTSPFTDEPVRSFFERHKYFGLKSNQVTFFKQGTVLCISKDGKFVMETPFKISEAPDGNGGVYQALMTLGLLDDMESRGIRYIDCYGVDNALVRIADPCFLGYFIEKGVDAAAKVVQKAYPEEKVGVFARRGGDGPLSVIEYSELDQSLASEINQETGRLQFCWSNICLHMFTLDFLKRAANNLERDSTFHLAEKRIPCVNGYEIGYKLEQFIFDAFPYSRSMALFEVVRDEEFAPVKNVSGSSSDTPDRARLQVLGLHARWVKAAGGVIVHSVPSQVTGNSSNLLMLANT